MRKLTSLIAVFCALFWTTQVSAAAPENGSKSVLADVDPLKQPVSFSETKIPVGELLQKISKATGVPLYADRPISDEPLAVVVDKMPAVRLLEEIATFLDYRWRREGKADARSYVLFQEAEQRQAEEAIREAALKNEQTRLKINARDFFNVGKLSDQDYATARQAEENRPKGQGPRTPAEDRFRRAVLACNDSARRALGRMLGHLQPADWDALQNEEPLVYYTNPLAGERGLPNDIAQSLTSFRPSTAPFRQFGAANSPEAAQRQARSDEVWAGADGVRVVIRMKRPAETSENENAAPGVTVTAIPLASAQQNPRENEGVPEQIRLFIYPMSTQVGWGEDSPERAAALDKDEVLDRQRVFQPKLPHRVKERPDEFHGQSSDYLPDLAHAFGISILADSYWTAPVQTRAYPASEAPVALKTVLARIAQTAYARPYYRFDRHDDFVQLRSRMWFFDRPREVPLKVVRQWEKKIAMQGALSLEDCVEAATTLHPLQLLSLENAEGVQVFPPRVEAPRIYQNREALRLFGMLTAQQRRQVLQGGPLPGSAMSRAQQNQFSLMVLDDLLNTAGRITPADFATAGVSLASSPLELYRQEHGYQVTYRAVAPGTNPSTIFEEPKPAPPGEEAGSPLKTSHFPVAMAGFQVQWGSRRQMDASLCVAR